MVMIRVDHARCLGMKASTWEMYPRLPSGMKTVSCGKSKAEKLMQSTTQ
jgi:hypothetical protein